MLENYQPKTYGSFDFEVMAGQEVSPEQIQQVWTASQDQDEAAFRPPTGWWSLTEWARVSRGILKDNKPVGVAALAYSSEANTAEIRLALLREHREPYSAQLLVELALGLAEEANVTTLRFYLPSQASWAKSALALYGFEPIRALHLMLRPAHLPLPPAKSVTGVRIRPLKEGEEELLLHALNEAWANTWNFQPIKEDALLADLKGQRNGFLVAVSEVDETEIVGTVHGIFDPVNQNPDGQPYSWISNLTTSPRFRGQGLGRALLVAGLEYLGRQGAGSIALGVDGGNPIPLTLYRSAGFESISQLEIWER